MLSAAQHIVPLHACNLARQPCPEAKYQIQLKILQYCPISPCFQHIASLHAPLPCSLARLPCPAALPGILARHPCPAALPKLVQAFPAIKDIAILSLVYELISTCERG
jgi:hypothetical protein